MIYIIRHGQTENNKAKLLQGRSDIPLNKDGIRQAEAAAKWFCDQQIRIDSVYSSPLIRAVETAKIIAPEAPLFIEERLIEMDYGPYEGMDLTNPAPEVRVFFLILSIILFRGGWNRFLLSPQDSVNSWKRSGSRQKVRILCSPLMRSR